jgi:putative component of membrane protein insertase Oxa1/YidC/SpoIIIJ protein YidD
MDKLKNKQTNWGRIIFLNFYQLFISKLEIVLCKRNIGSYLTPKGSWLLVHGAISGLRTINTV